MIQLLLSLMTSLEKKVEKASHGNHGGKSGKGLENKVAKAKGTKDGKNYHEKGSSSNYKTKKEGASSYRQGKEGDSKYKHEHKKDKDGKQHKEDSKYRQNKEGSKYKEIQYGKSEHERLEEKPRYKPGDFAEQMERYKEQVKQAEKEGHPHVVFKDKDGKIVYYDTHKAGHAYHPVKKKPVSWWYREGHKPGSQSKTILEEYNAAVHGADYIRKKMPGRQSLTDRVKGLFTNLPNQVRNAYDNTVGYLVASLQNKAAVKHYKSDPKSKDKIVFLMHGVAQNIGSQWRLAKELEEKGYHVYHVHADHTKPREKVADDAFKQIKDFYKEAGIKDPSQATAYFSGHSSGADAGIYMAGDERILEYGIKQVQARAPAPSGMKLDTLGRKLIGIAANLTHDDVGSSDEAKLNAVEMVKREPYVPVHIVAGSHDDLVHPKDTVYQHAEKHWVIKDKASTHFGTSGANKEMNQVFVELFDYFGERQQQRRKIPKTYEAEY